MSAEARDPRVVARTTLDSGLEVVRQASPESAGSFSATYVGPAGSGYDPEGLEGVAMLTTTLLPSGAGPWDRIGLDRLLDGLGATLGRHCDSESSEVTVWGPEANWRRLLEILSEVASHPRLAPEDVARVRRQIAERQLRERTQPDSRAESELTRAVFPPGHPYRLSGLGSPVSLRRLTPERARAFHRRHFASSGGLVVVTGRAPLSSVAREAAKRFDDLPAARPPASPRAGTRSRGSSSRRISLPGRAQVEIRIGGASLPRDSPQYPAAFLANEVLGGRPLLSRLFQNVRERHGLAYHASSELQSMRWGGYWAVAAGTGPERVTATERLLREEVIRLTERPIARSELEKIRESTVGELPLSLETTSGAHELAVDIAYHHLSNTFLRDWPAVLRALRPPAVQEAASVAFDAENSVTIVAGPPSPAGR